MTSDLSTGAACLDYCRRRLTDEYLPRLLRCIGEMSDEDIWWRPAESSNSAGNLVLHLAGNVNQWINSGLGGLPDRRNRAAEFSERGPVPRTELVERITTAVRDAGETLSKLDPQGLMEMRHIQVFDLTGLEAVLHVVEHFSQHLGQIVYITKLRKRVDLKFYDL
jgi:uncharacterized damage-inducible protein DinB